MPELVFGKYEAIRRLAVGGMGEIFLGRQRAGGFDRLVILKTLLADLAQEEGSVDQFLDEARVAATLNHPNIVSMYEVGLWNGVHFIVMEYINGDSVAGLLATAAKTKSTIPFAVTARIVHDAATGLDHAHHATDPDGRPLCIIHRDVTPQNIMVRTDGVTKVVDFGVARAANRATKTEAGLLKGKLSYMPPEQLGGKELDARTDQWGLGVVMWECLTGQRLFRADNELEIMRMIIEREIPAPSTLVKGLPPQLDTVVMRMLRRDRDERYSRLGEVAEALRGYLDSASDQGSENRVAAFVKRTVGERVDERVRDLTPSTTTLPAFLRQGAGQRSGRRGLFLGLAAAALVAGAVAVGAAVFRQKASPPPSTARAPALDVASPRPASEPGPTAADAATSLVVMCDPVGAMVYSGERLLGQAPLRLRTLLPETDYQLVVEKPGFQPSIVKVRLERGKEKQISVTLKKKASRGPVAGGSAPSAAPGPAAAPVAEDGFLTLTTKPWTRVTIDGTPYGSTPLFRVKLKKGAHKMVLVNEGEGVNETRSFSIEAGTVSKLDLSLKK